MGSYLDNFVSAIICLDKHMSIQAQVLLCKARRSITQRIYLLPFIIQMELRPTNHWWTNYYPMSPKRGNIVRDMKKNLNPNWNKRERRTGYLKRNSIIVSVETATDSVIASRSPSFY